MKDLTLAPEGIALAGRRVNHSAKVPLTYLNIWLGKYKLRNSLPLSERPSTGITTAQQTKKSDTKIQMNVELFNKKQN